MKHLPYVWLICLLNVIPAVVSKLCAQPLNHIAVEGDKFKDGTADFYAVTMNYGCNVTLDHSTGNYHLEPHWNYSSDWVQNAITGTPGRFWLGNPVVANNKVQADLNGMQSKNFTAIRSTGFSPTYNYTNNTLLVPSGNLNTYFTLFDDLLQKAENSDIRVIALLGAPTTDLADDAYVEFLTAFATRYANNKTLMAIDFWNEPTNDVASSHAKIFTASRVTRWVDAVKSEAPNLLTTIGFAFWESTVGWDQAVLPIDFASPHAYGWSDNLAYCNDVLAATSYWYNQTCAKPWIIGETGFSGTDIPPSQLPYPDTDNKTGTELEQKQFADFALARTRDCECNGFSWWNYQELFWNSGVSPFEDYLGLKTRYSNANGESWKQAADAFTNFSPNPVNASSCVKPNNYYNIYQNTGGKLYGTVKDATTGLPIVNAEAYAKTTVWSNSFAYTQANGSFELTAHSGTAFHSAMISATGYDAKLVNSPAMGSNIGTIYLHKQDYINNWMKEWDNHQSNTIDGWTIRPGDQFHAGDFDGDGKDELLCVAGGWITLLDFENGEWIWEWSNYGSSSHGLFPYRNNLLVGDFNGDGQDEVLGNLADKGGWITLFRYENNDFVWKWSDGGGKHAMRPYADDLIVGDFNGDGRDEILGNNEDQNGWITLFRLEGFSKPGNLSNADFVWKWTDAGSHAMRPYRDNLIAGDFNGDGQDEILGNNIDGKGWITLFRLEGFTQPWDLASADFVWKWTDGGNHAMRPYRNDLTVGDFDGDGKDELLGRNSWITLFELEGFSQPGNLSNADFAWKWTTGVNNVMGDMVVGSNHTLFPFVDKPSVSSLILLSQNTNGNFAKLFRQSNLEETQKVKHNRLNVAGNNAQFQPEDGSISDQEALIVFPNPTNGHFNLVFDNDEEKLIRIFNIQGVEIRVAKTSAALANFDLENEPAGIYLIQVATANQILTQKVIVE